MSAEEQIDGCNVICPYCEESYQREIEDYSEGERVEECEGCGKKYHTWDCFSVDHHTTPDCEINDEEHEWENFTSRTGAKALICAKCGSAKLPELKKELE